LIAALVGDEGLEIGKVDLIICYDTGFSPVRALQRIRKTNRKPNCKAYILLQKGRELDMYNNMKEKDS